MTVDVSGWLAGMERLKSPQLRESLARSMGVAGGKILRDEAKRWVPVESGRLKKSIYLAHSDRSTLSQQIYRVSWNSNKFTGAPHGHLVEFGHWMQWQVVPTYDGFKTLAEGVGGGPNAVPHKGGPVKVEAKPFLRPAYDIGLKPAKAAMVARGRARLPELLAGVTDEP